MKLLIKKILPVVITLTVILSALTFSVSAAGSSVAFNSTQLSVGDTLTVTARFSTTSSDPMYALEGYITYNPAVIEFVSGGNSNLLTAGKAKIVLQSSGKTNLEETITFKALAAGSATIALENLIYVNTNEEEKPLDGCSAAVTVVNKSAQASSNANLKGLSVSSGTLTPKFNPDVTEYSVTIANDVEELWVNASKADAKASYSVEGSRKMKVGVNKRVIVVTAENGTVKRYTVNITRLDENGQIPENEEQEGLNNLSEVIVGDQKMYVVEDLTGEELPQGFSVIEYAFDGKTIPALSDDNYILLMLKNSDNTEKALYVYDKNGVFTKLLTIEVGGQIFNILPAEETPDGYSAVNDFAIGEVVVPAYKSDKAGYGDFALVFAKGPGGKVGFYRYDTIDKTIQRVAQAEFEDPNEEVGADVEEPEKTDIITSFMELNTNGKIVVITILAIIVLLIAAIIVLIVKIASAGKTDEEDEDVDEDDLNDNANAIVGFEYISVADAKAEEPEEAAETEEANEEESEEEEATESDEDDSEQ